MKSPKPFAPSMVSTINAQRARRRNQELKEASGSYVSTDPLTSFLYTLMIEHVPLAVIQTAINSVEEGETHYSNGFAAKYAEYCSKKIRSLRPLDHSHFQTALRMLVEMSSGSFQCAEQKWDAFRNSKEYARMHEQERDDLDTAYNLLMHSVVVQEEKPIPVLYKSKHLTCRVLRRGEEADLEASVDDFIRAVVAYEEPLFLAFGHAIVLKATPQDVKEPMFKENAMSDIKARLVSGMWLRKLP